MEIVNERRRPNPVKHTEVVPAGSPENMINSENPIPESEDNAAEESGLLQSQASSRSVIAEQ